MLVVHLRARSQFEKSKIKYILQFLICRSHETFIGMETNFKMYMIVLFNSIRTDSFFNMRIELLFYVYRSSR